MTSKSTEEYYREQAKLQYYIDGEIEIDGDAKISTNDSPGEAHGAYVAVFLPKDSIPKDVIYVAE